MSTKIPVLILKDRATDVNLMVQELRQAGFDPSWQQAATEPDYLAALETKPELILSDWSMLHFKGSSALKLLRERGLDIPFIIVSGRIGEETVLEAFRQGASDFVRNDHLARLGQAVRFSLEAKQLRDQRKQAGTTLDFKNVLLCTQQEVSIDGILVVDVNNEIVSWNRRLIEMTGIPQELIEKRSNEPVLRFLAEQMAEPEQFLQHSRTLSENTLESSNEELAFKDGRLIARNSAPMFGSDGRYHGRIWYFHDLTEAKLAKEELARQAEELRQRNEELARLYRASAALISGPFISTQEQAGKIVEVVQQEFGQDNCSLFLARKDSNDLERQATAGPYADQVKNAKLTLSGPGLVARALRAGNALNVPDVRQEMDYLPNWDATRSELTIPLKIGENVIGAIDVQSPELNAFSQDDERLMAIFAERAALAMEHSRLNAQTETRIQQLQALRTIDMAITANFEIDLTLDVLLDQVIRQLGAHAVDVLILDAATQTLKLIVERGLHSRELHQNQLDLGMGYAWQAVWDRRPVSISNMEAAPAGSVRSSDLADEQFVAYLGMPLITKGQVRGVLEIFQREPLRFEPDWFRFVEILAGQAAIAIDNAELFSNLQSSNSELGLAYNSTLEGWASALELRDHDTGGHTRRTTELTIRLAQILGVQEKDLDHMYRGALLHDIGKMGLSDKILLSPGPLTEEEWGIMRKHPQYAYDLLSPIAYLRPALDIPYCHHEKWDGTGYPRGLKEKQIPLSARIFAVVDVWDALTSDRPYRKAWPAEKAIDYIREQSGKQFDPKVVEIFLREVNITKKDIPANESARQLATGDILQP